MSAPALLLVGLLLGLLLGIADAPPWAAGLVIVVFSAATWGRL